jgi:predicted permease
MNLAPPVASFIAIFILMILLTLFLRWRAVLSPKHAPILSALITEAVMPALIFSQVAQARVHAGYLAIAGVVAITELLSGVIAAAFGAYVLRLERRSLGSYVLASSFGSTSLIGNALLEIVFAGDTAVRAMGIIVGQFGVGLPNNTIGLLIGMRSGDQAVRRSASQLLRDFARTPPVLALAAGLAWSRLDLPASGPFVSPVFGALTLVSAGLPFMAAAVTGLTASWISWRRFLTAILSSQCLQLLLQPLISLAVFAVIPLPPTERAVAVLMAALPASPLAAVYASRYGGDSEMATALVMSSAVISIATLPIIGAFT